MDIYGFHPSSKSFRHIKMKFLLIQNIIFVHPKQFPQTKAHNKMHGNKTKINKFQYMGITIIQLT